MPTVETKQITVTSPLLPAEDEFQALCHEIWQSRWITNNGQFHRRLEKELADYLGVPFLSLFTNGTLPLLTALQALHITGEVITTPYSFVATTHSIWWNGCQPVFVDVDPATGNIDPDKIEAAITPRTTAIMPVHVYGYPCDVRRIREIADRHGLKVIYDAAHAFGVRIPSVKTPGATESVLNYGDLSTLSFHATKVYNTVEGGAMVMHDEITKKHIDDLKNFGFHNEVTVVGPGINSKMDEVRSAYGLLNLRQVDAAIAARKKAARCYVEALKGLEGVSMFPYMREAFAEALPADAPVLNGSYFPIFIDEEKYGMTRDALYALMKSHNVLGRRYFYPLISDFSTYKDCPGADRLPVARRMADQVICLPMHHLLTEEDLQRILDIIINKR